MHDEWKERIDLLSQKSALLRMKEQIPKEDVLDMASVEVRLAVVEERLVKMNSNEDVNSLLGRNKANRKAVAQEKLRLAKLGFQIAEFIADASKVDLVEPEQLRSYVEETGWVSVRSNNDAVAIYCRPNDELEQLIIPLRWDYDDYPERLAEAICRLAAFEKLEFQEMLQRYHWWKSGTYE